MTVSPKPTNTGDAISSRTVMTNELVTLPYPSSTATIRVWLES